MSKLLAFFLVPSNILLMAFVAGAVLLFTRRALLGRWLVAISASFLLAFGMFPLGIKLIDILESRFPVWDTSRGPPVGFIILGGAVNPTVSAQRNSVSLDASAERLTIVAELARKYPTAKFIYSGGNGGLLGGLAEADYVMPLFESFGIPPERITLERASRTTYENATDSKIIASPKPGDRWVVITSAVHMPRAIGSFRAAGFEVEAFPVDWQNGTQGVGFKPMSSLSSGLGAMDYAVREFIGLLAYWLSGRSSEPFPAPH